MCLRHQYCNWVGHSVQQSNLLREGKGCPWSASRPYVVDKVATAATSVTIAAMNVTNKSCARAAVANGQVAVPDKVCRIGGDQPGQDSTGHIWSICVPSCP